MPKRSPGIALTKDGNSISKWKMKTLSKKPGRKIVWIWAAESVGMFMRMTKLDEKVTAVKWNYLNLRTKLDLPAASKARPGAPPTNEDYIWNFSSTQISQTRPQRMLIKLFYQLPSNLRQFIITPEIKGNTAHHIKSEAVHISRWRGLGKCWKGEMVAKKWPNKYVLNDSAKKLVQVCSLLGPSFFDPKLTRLMHLLSYVSHSM